MMLYLAAGKSAPSREANAQSVPHPGSVFEHLHQELQVGLCRAYVELARLDDLTGTASSLQACICAFDALHAEEEAIRPLLRSPAADLLADPQLRWGVAALRAKLAAASTPAPRLQQEELAALRIHLANLLSEAIVLLREKEFDASRAIRNELPAAVYRRFEERLTCIALQLQARMAQEPCAPRRLP